MELNAEMYQRWRDRMIHEKHAGHRDANEAVQWWWVHQGNSYESFIALLTEAQHLEWVQRNLPLIMIDLLEQS